MSEIEVYTVEDEHGEWQGEWPLAEIEEARKAARDAGGKLVCLTYEFSDSELVEDYSVSDEAPDPGLLWYYTGSLNSKAHIGEVAPFQNVALCGAGVVSDPREIRPKKAEWCNRCVREVKLRGFDPTRVGIYDIDISDTGSEETDYS